MLQLFSTHQKFIANNVFTHIKKNITLNKSIYLVNIDYHDLSNYGSPSTSDKNDLPNMEISRANVSFETSSSND